MAKKSERIIEFRLDPAHPPQLTPAQAKRLDAMTDDEIDYSDIPELPDDFFRKHPPVSRLRKQQITIRLDPDILAFFRAQGPGYQGRINAVLRAYVQAMGAPLLRHQDERTMRRLIAEHIRRHEQAQAQIEKERQEASGESGVENG